MEYKEFLPVGIIQTTVEKETAWKDDGVLKGHMNPEAENMVMEEIRRGFQEFSSQGTATPRIVLLPEYSIPHSGIKRLQNYAKSTDTVVIGGCDLFVNGNSAQNKGVILIPNRWPELDLAFSCNEKYFGKTYFSKTELSKWFGPLKLAPSPETTNYIIDAGEFGNIGIAICADIYDIERFAIYKGYIHHLFIIAYNQDTRSFEYLAEAISRLLMCNVVICNAGQYGDSLAISPYSEGFKRTVFQNVGNGLFTSQVICLPVKKLDEEQYSAHQLYQQELSAFPSNHKATFKWAPGFKKYVSD